MKRLALAILALLVLAAPALAADHEATLSGAAPRFEWEGAPHLTRGAPLYDETARTSIPCGSGPLRECETVLLEVTEPGRLTVKVDGQEGTGGTTDVDAYIYESDAQGSQGELISSSAANGPDSVQVKAPGPGFYLFLADYYHSYNSGYTGVATFASSAPAPEPAAPPAVTPPPAEPAPAKPSKSKAKACKAKAKKIKNKKKRKKAMKRCKRKG